METMVKKKANGVLELSETTLGEIASFEMGQAPPGADCNMEGLGTVFVKAGEFGDLYPEKKEWTTKPLKYGKDGDVFICVVGATTGKLNLGIDCAIGRSVAAIRPNAGYDARFVYYQLLPSVLRLRASSAGSAQGVLSKKQLSEIPFVVAPLPEQRRIVSAIERHLGRLDAAVARLHAAKAKLKRYRQAVLKAAVEGRLLYSDLVEGELPEDWTWTTLGEAVDLVSGGTPKGLNESTAGGIIPFFKVGDMTLDGNDRYMETSRTYLTPVEAKRLKLTIQPAGTVIFPKRGGAILTNKKRVLSGPGAFDLNLMGAIPNDEIDGGFLFYWFEQLDLSKIYDGSNIPQINKKNVDPLPFAKPPLKDQRRIAAELDRLLISSNETETTLDAQLQQAVRLRQAVLKRAFEGRLV